MASYVVAVKRQRPGFSLETALRAVPGIEIRGSGDVRHVLIEADAEAISVLRARYGDALIVERQIKHNLLTARYPT